MSYFSRFQPQHLVEFRAIRAGEAKRNWIPAEDYPLYEASLGRHNEAGWNIYASVNPRSGRGSGEDAVAEIVCFHVDIDDARHSVLSHANPANESPATFATPVPAPSMTVSSGGGRHFYWHLAEPVAVTEGNRLLLKGINRGLALAVNGDTACHDLARILRVPGFLNWKYQPPRHVKLVEQNDRRYTIRELESLAVEVAAVPEMQDVAVIPLTDELKERFRVARGQDRSGIMRRAWRGEIGDGSSDSRYVLAKMLADAGFTAEETVAVLCSRTWHNREERRRQTPERVMRHAQRLASLSLAGVAREACTATDASSAARLSR